MLFSRACIALLVLAAACGDNKQPSVPPDGPPRAIDAPPAPDAPADANPACLAPTVITPDPNAQAAATAQLATLSPTATMEWSAERGTLTSISGLVVELPSCTGTVNVYDQMLDVVSQSPALFQIDRTEWQGSVLQCADVLANGFNLVVIRRNKYGSYAMQHDVFSAVADVQNGKVILRNFSGVYIPPPSAEILNVLSGCPDLTSTTLDPLLRAKPFVYERFALPPADICTADGDFSYSAKPNDTLTFDPAVTADWDDSVTPITLRRQSSAMLVVDSSNYTVDLMSSSANCVDETATPHIGWIRTFNTVTGEILSDHATPDPFCTVCFH